MKHLQYPNTYVVWDLETSGLEKSECKILEIGFMRVINGVPSERMSWVLNHGIVIPPEIVTLTGITQEIIDKEGKDPKQSMADFLDILGKSIDRGVPHLTHNGMRFDIGWLAYHAAKTFGWTRGQHRDFELKLYSSAIDTAVFVKAGKLKMTRNWNEPFDVYAMRVMNTIAKGVKYNVAICCEELDIDKSKVTQHRALGDVELTHQIYQKLLA